MITKCDLFFTVRGKKKRKDKRYGHVICCKSPARFLPSATVKPPHDLCFVVSDISDF